ncbi:MAG: sulfatase [Pirellulales bacterium]|nr:sulfatase [Pirellulales bacterium]
MHRLRFVFGFALLLAGLLGHGPAGYGDDRPNLLFLMTDDQRNDTLGCAGHDIVLTPHIDRLASQGVRFENMFVSSSICWVSRATILTGQYARSWGSSTQPDKIRPGQADFIFPKILREQGYRTGFFGKWHAKMPAGFRQADHFDVYQDIFRRPYFKPQSDGSLRHTTQIIGDRAVEFLADQPGNQPFALTLWFNASHAEDGDKRPGIGHFPWPKVVDGMYEEVAMPPPRLNDPAIFAAQPEFLRASLNRQRFFWRWDTEEKYQTNLRAYFRMISGIDHVLGRVIRQLEASGLADNTIIVYTADNGYYMGDRGFAGKWSHYEQSLRVPLVIYDPRLPAAKRGRVVDPLAVNVDLPATFLDWAGIDRPDSYQGRSLRPILERDRLEDWREDFFCEHVVLAPRITWEGVRNRGYIYARYFDQKPVYEFLHDLDADPDQLVNLAKSAKHAEQLARMRSRCDELVDRYGGPLAPLEARGARGKKAAPAKKKP